jgi:hypothetical protein
MVSGLLIPAVIGDMCSGDKCLLGEVEQSPIFGDGLIGQAAAVAS